jgi:putative CocE/NonD family hydrolase
VPEGVGNVTFYVMGSNENGAPGEYWTTMADVPIPTPTPLFLQPGGGLGPSPAAGPASAAYTYDPADPVPTMGGNNLLIPCGPMDQRPIEKAKRQDVLIFTTPPLTQQMAVTGGLQATIYLSTDAVDTDIVVKLIDVYPASSSDPTLAGSSTLVADGIARLRWRDFPATNEPQLLSGNPADVVKVSVSLWNTSYIFAPGHSIRVHVTSSNFPRFTPNPNNGLPVDKIGANVTAHTTIHFDAAHPSAFILPVVDAATQLPEFPVEEATAQALRPFEEAWRAGRIAAGEDGTEGMVEWVARRVGKVADANLRFGRVAAQMAHRA